MHGSFGLHRDFARLDHAVLVLLLVVQLVLQSSRTVSRVFVLAFGFFERDFASCRVVDRRFIVEIFRRRSSRDFPATRWATINAA